jgi:hypothetical protein
MSEQPPRLDWRNVSTPNLRDFIGSDRGRDVGAHLSDAASTGGMEVERLCDLAVPGVTGGYETDPKEARLGISTGDTLQRAWIAAQLATSL